MSRSDKPSPPHQYTSLLRHIERMAYQGMTVEQIADRIGVEPAAFQQSIDSYADLRIAIEQGRARGIADLTAAAKRGRSRPRK